MDSASLTKSGIMLGLGETWDEILQVMDDMRAHDVDIITMGQYLQPSRFHLPIERYVHLMNLRHLEGRRRKTRLQVGGKWPIGAQQLPRRWAGAFEPAC